MFSIYVDVKDFSFIFISFSLAYFLMALSLISVLLSLLLHFYYVTSSSQPGGSFEDQERTALILSSYKKSLEKCENNLAISRLEVATLQVQLRSLIEGSRRIVSTNRSSKIGEDNDSNGKTVEQQLGQAKYTILSLNEQIEQLTKKKRYVRSSSLMFNRLFHCHRSSFIYVHDHLFYHSYMMILRFLMLNYVIVEVTHLIVTHVSLQVSLVAQPSLRFLLSLFFFNI